MKIRLNPVPKRIWIYGVASVAAIALILYGVLPEKWRGIVVAPEVRCSPYSQDDYRYSPSVKADIVAGIGKVYSPYTGRCFSSAGQTEIEHIVARSEAHDSGLCGASAETRRAFSNDLENLTLASSQVNSAFKRANDAAEWMPDENQCWFADRIVQVRRKHGLTIDREEADALERVLSACGSTEMVIHPCPSTEEAESPAVVVTASKPLAQGAETWRGIAVAPEERCSPYSADDYRYAQSVKADIVAGMGKIYSPYTGRCFSRAGETDIEHIVARSEAHDSGLCGASEETRKAFANDLENLTLASPQVNRVSKGTNDAAEWMPDENQCWFAERIVQVRLKHGLTIDREEADALERVLSACESTEMVIRPCTASEDAEVDK